MNKQILTSLTGVEFIQIPDDDPTRIRRMNAKAGLERRSDMSTTKENRCTDSQFYEMKGGI